MRGFSKYFKQRKALVSKDLKWTNGILNIMILIVYTMTEARAINYVNARHAPNIEKCLHKLYFEVVIYMNITALQATRMYLPFWMKTTRRITT